MNEKRKALVLMSGGLDSSLALAIIHNFGIKAECLYFSMPFCHAVRKPDGLGYVKSLTGKLGVKLKIIDNEETLLEIIKDPKHGFGANMNPCIDCKIGIFKKARELMAETEASFIVTGEVLGQRPMSQQIWALNKIDSEAGLTGLVVRPLSAKKMKITIPEKEGWVDREEFYGISGRGRREQMELAVSMGINEYPTPAGGCLLTDPGYSKRLKDLIEHKKEFSKSDAGLLKYGRHFRISENLKLIVGRNETENSILEMVQKDNEILINTGDIPGPNSLLVGKFTMDDIKFGASVTARFSDVANRSKMVEVRYKSRNGIDNTVNVFSAQEEEYGNLRI